jgi:hypothetical protein
MNQHLLVKIPERRTRSAGPVQLGTPHRCVANLGKAQNTRFAHGAQPMSEANALAAAINDVRSHSEVHQNNVCMFLKSDRIPTHPTS